MEPSAFHDEVLFPSEFPFIFVSAFYSPVWTFGQPKDIYGVLNKSQALGRQQ